MFAGTVFDQEGVLRWKCTWRVQQGRHSWWGGAQFPGAGAGKGHGVGTAGKWQMPAGAWAAEDATPEARTPSPDRWAGAGGGITSGVKGRAGPKMSIIKSCVNAIF